MFIKRIKSSVDESTLERERSWVRGELDRGDGIARITDSAGILSVLDDAESCFRESAKRSQDTQEFDEAIQLLREVRDLVTENKPVPATVILKLIHKIWLDRNWERLPKPLYERKRILDRVLIDLCFRGDPSQPLLETRAYSILSAAHTYVENTWMHTPWLTALIAREAVESLNSSVKERQRTLLRWRWHPFTVGLAGAILWEFLPSRRAMAILLFLVCIVQSLVGYRNEVIQAKLGRISDDLHSDVHSGPVLAERLERLNSLAFRVPSIVIAVLRVRYTEGDSQP
jgi:hypothetical protein